MNRETLVTLKSEVSKQFSGTTKYSKAFRRGNTQSLDISQTFPTFEHAFVYALNDTENDNYVPYAGQVISEAENGTVYILRKYSADVREIWLPAGEGETPESYEIKKTDRFHYYLQEIKTVEGDNSKYLSADKDDNNNGHTLTVGKLVSQKGADVTGNVNVTGDVNATGNITGTNVTATEKVTTPEVVTGSIHSEGADAQNGFIIGKETNGGYTMYVDNLHVRNKMTVETLETEETTYVGGKLVLTPGSGIECKKVEYGTYANGQGFKCWFTNEVDGVIKHNTFQVGDLALCESFNNSQNTFYWREVAEVGDDYIILSDVEGKYHTKSGSPKAGDKIVQCGNIKGGERASAIVLSSVDTGSPFVAQYKNIKTFEWTTPVTRLSDDGNIITGTLKTDSGKDVEKYINDTNETIGKLQEGMQSLGDDNFVIWQADYPSPKTDAGTISEEFTWSSFTPSNEWAVADLDSHTGDYLICSDGIVYVFRCVDKSESEYIWKIVTDKYLIDALNKALQAQDSADKANQILANICDDGIITAQEKIALSKTWDNMKVTYLTKRNEGLKNGYDTDNTSIANALTEAYSNLVAAMESVLADMATDTDISGGISGNDNLSFVACWGNYFDRFEIYCKGLDDFIKTNTDKIGADATSALNTLKEMADDGIITAQEKITLRNTWQTIKSQYTTKIADGSLHGFKIDNESLTEEFMTAFNNLTEVMNIVLADITTDTDITKNLGENNLSFTICWDAYFKAYESYTEALDVFLKDISDTIAEGAENALQTLNEMADDGIITAQEKISLKDWWNNELNEANSIIANANKIYGETTDANANWYKFLSLKNLAVTLMGNVLLNMDSSTDISASGSIFVTKDAVQSATKDTTIEGSLRADKNLVWSEFWAIYYQYKATCQNTAEAKAKVFVTAENVLPTPPYKKGDMWICPSYTNWVDMGGEPTPINYIKETFFCVNEKGSSGTASFSDWQVMYDQTSSHLEVLKDSIKFWVEQDSDIAEKIKSGIDLLAEGVKIYTKSGEKINLISVGKDGIKINADLIKIDAGELDIKSQLAKFTTNELEIISTYFKVDKDGRITATAGSIGGYEITEHGIKYVDNTTGNQVNLNELGIYFGQTASTVRMTSISADGKITAIDADLTGKITATSGKIANMDISIEEVSYKQQSENGGYFSFSYDGIKAGYMTANESGDGYNPVVTTTIGKDGTITAPNVEFNKDGSGHVAGGNIAWDKDGNASFRGEVNAERGKFRGSLALQSNPIPDQADIELSFETGFNFSGCNYAPVPSSASSYVQVLRLPTGTEYEGVRCVIENTAKVTQTTTIDGKTMMAKRFNIVTKDGSSFRLNGISNNENIKTLEVYGMGHVELHSAIIDGKLRWIVDNAEGFKRLSYDKTILSTWRGMPHLTVVTMGRYELSGSNYSYLEDSTGDNHLWATRLDTGRVKFEWDYPLQVGFYIPIVVCEGHGYGWCSSKSTTEFIIETADDNSNNDLAFYLMIVNVLGSTD